MRDIKRLGGSDVSSGVSWESKSVFSSKLFLMFAVAAVVLSLFSVGLLYLSVGNFVNLISGRVTGTANLTVEPLAAVNFTTNSVNWGSGRVNTGVSRAYLLAASDGFVVNGNWTTVVSGLILKNTGNTNVTLNLSVGKTAASFIGGTNPVYQWMVTEAQINSCFNSTGGTGGMAFMGQYLTPNTTSSTYCAILFPGLNGMEINFNLSIPSDSITGALGDIVTAVVYI